MQVKPIPPQILVKLCACVLALALLVVAMLLPQRQHIKKLRQNIVAAKADIRRQTALMPTYAKLMAQEKLGLPKSIPPLQELRLTKDGITDIQSIFVNAAEARMVFPESVVPDPSSLTADGKALSVNCVLHGTLPDLRALLLDLGAMSALRGVEKIAVREEGLEAAMQIKAWMTLE